MYRTILCLILLLSHSSAYAQWFSLEAEIGEITLQNQTRGMSKLNNYVSSSLIGGDTIYSMITETAVHKESYILDDIVSLRGNIRYHLPLSRKLTFSTGLGLNFTSFDYKYSESLEERMIVDEVLLHNYVPPPLFTSDGILCDTLLASGISLSETDFSPRITNEIINIQLPVYLSYALIKDNLNLISGFNIGIALMQEQSSSSLILREDPRFSVTDHTACRYGLTSFKHDHLENFSFEGVMGIEFKIVNWFWSNLKFSQSFTALNNTNGLDTGGKPLPSKIFPWFVRVGISTDLGGMDKLVEKRSKYLFSN